MMGFNCSRPMTSSGTVLFERGTTTDKDLWDDTELVRAYDEAVRSMRNNLYSSVGTATKKTGESSVDGPSKGKSKPRGSAFMGQTMASAGWKEGDLCKCIYSGDGEYYNAKIVGKVDLIEGKCIVRYLGFDETDTEEQYLNQLAPFDPELTVEEEEGDDGAEETEADHETDRLSSVKSAESEHSTGHHEPSRGNKHRATGRRQQDAADFEEALSDQNEPKPRYQWKSQNQYSPQSQQRHRHHHVHPHHQPNGIVMPPPPVPPVLVGGSSSHPALSDTAALNSMLMSWYMSGFHTGYYQGLRAAQAQTRRARTTNGSPLYQQRSKRH